MKKEKAVTPGDFPDNLLKKIPDVWKNNVETKTNEELEQEILRSEQIISNTEKDIKKDDKIKALNEQLKDLKGGYKDLMDTEKAKVKYALYKINERGKFFYTPEDSGADS